MSEESVETRVAERRAERARNDLGDTLSALKEKMSFTSIWDELGGHLTSGDASRFMSNLTAQVRDNPMPIVLVGAGLAWLMMSGRSHGAHPAHVTAYPARHTGYVVPPAHATSVSSASSSSEGSSGLGSIGAGASEMARRAGEGMSEMGERMSDAASSATQSVGQSMQDMAGRVSEAAGSAGQGIAEGAQSMASTASETMHGLASSASGAGSYARETFSDMLERQPLVVGALAVALGAAIGAALPSTSFENEQMGETSDDLKERIAERGETVLDRGAEVVSRVYETAREEIGAAASEVSHAADEELHKSSDVLPSGGMPSQRP